MFSLGLITLFSVAFGCIHDPSEWCSTEEIAKSCNVVEQCAKYQESKVGNKVRLSVYIESLCPDCKNFIRQQLWPAFMSVGDIISLDIIPYGNAQEKFNAARSKWEFKCQHGPDECDGNVIEACAINLLNYKADKYFPFINCIEASKLLPSEVAETCAHKLGIDYQAIRKCAAGRHGNNLEHLMARRTDSLEPAHTYVPWVTVNGKHTETMQKKAWSNLVGLICEQYKGANPPASCQRKYERCMTQSPVAAKPVEVALYFESLCPGCRQFILDQLWPAYNKLGGSIMNITLVPYGNAIESKSGAKWQFTCQHGEQECIGNIIETCALNRFGARAFSFIHCLEKSPGQSMNEKAQKCCQQLRLPWRKISTCAQSSLGNELEHKMAERTNALNPPHKYVPWITVNGHWSEKQQDRAQGDLVSLVCDLYQGPKPKACETSVCQREPVQLNLNEYDRIRL